MSVFDSNEYALMAEDSYQHDLWKAFFKSIAIKERKNLNLQKQHMPKMYWTIMLKSNRIFSNKCKFPVTICKNMIYYSWDW